MTMSVDIKALTMSMKCFSKEEAGTSHYEKYNFLCESKVFSTGEAEANELLPCGMRRHVPGRGDRSLPSPGLPQHKTGLKQWKFTPGPTGGKSKIGVSAGSHCLRRLQGSTCLQPLPWLVAPGPLGDPWLGDTSLWSQLRLHAALSSVPVSTVASSCEDPGCWLWGPPAASVTSS